ncbi:hypothetical protein [Actinophytocola oryzae]|uniref:hypothetical protein n=1 Tax=Actinophytocola oryzae TaxID=502181 RepID=UPI0010631F10|nr:hypothetical protein [Actinophytocola oryzae]
MALEPFSPSDHDGHHDRVLIAELGKLNERLGHYILRYLAVDALQAEPPNMTEERRLAEMMTALAGRVLERAHRQLAPNAPSEPFEGDSRLRGT